MSSWLPRIRKLSVAVVVFWTAYFSYLAAGRVVNSEFEATAMANAWRIVELEQRLGLFWEPAWQEWAITSAQPLLGKGGLALLFNWAYIITFTPVMTSISVTLYITDRAAFRHYRNILLLSYGLAIVIFIAFPLAPPRMIPSHFVDTIAVFGPSGYASQGTEKYYNAYAAMPSLHFGCTLVFGVFFLRLPNLLAKICGFAYPSLMFSATIITANHYILDAVGGGLVMLVAFLFVELHLWHRILGSAKFLVRNGQSAFGFSRFNLRHPLGSVEDESQDGNSIGNRPSL